MVNYAEYCIRCMFNSLLFTQGELMSIVQSDALCFHLLIWFIGFILQLDAESWFRNKMSLLFPVIVHWGGGILIHSAKAGSTSCCTSGKSHLCLWDALRHADLSADVNWLDMKNVCGLSDCSRTIEVLCLFHSSTFFFCMVIAEETDWQTWSN